MSKRLCKKCGVTRPSCDFNGGKQTCYRHIKIQAPSTVKSRRRKEKKLAELRTHGSRENEISMKMLQVGQKNRQYTKKTLFGSGGMTRGRYAQYLQTPHWKEFKAQYKADPERLHECFVCGKMEYELHHMTYERLGKEKLEDIVPLCKTHHRATHAIEKAGHPLRKAHLQVKRQHNPTHHSE